MNEKSTPSSSRSPLEHDYRFDRLVDGELSDQEYSELLSSLDDQPDGWRRCATAFLEAQTWGHEFGSVRSDVAIDSPSPPVETKPKRGDGGQPVITWLAVAASFLLTLTIGLALRGWPGSGPDPGGTRIAVDQQVGAPDSDSPTERANEDRLIEPRTEQRLVASPDHDRASKPLGNVHLIMDGGEGTQREYDVPYFEVDQVSPRWLSQPPANVPTNVERALKRLGHEIRRSQRLVPATAKDGRQVMVPVEQIEIVPVSGANFQ